MKKLIFFSVACLMALVSCDKEQEIVLPDPTGAEFEAEVIAGSQLEITSANFVEGVKFYLGEKELQATVATTGAVVLVPYALGEFELSAVQNEVKYVLGKVTVKVKVTACPTEVIVGEDLVVEGQGFDVNAVLNLGETALETTCLNGTLTATVPETFVTGDYVLSVAQEGTSAVVAQVLTVKAKPVAPEAQLMSLAIDVVLPEELGGLQSYSAFAMNYENGEPKTFSFMGMYTFTINNYTDTRLDLTMDIGVPVQATCTIVDGKIATVSALNGMYIVTFEYDEEGHLISVTEEDTDMEETSVITFTWANGNMVHPALTYDPDPAMNINNTNAEFALYFDLVSDDQLLVGTFAPMAVYTASMLGLCGTTSVNCPVTHGGNPINITWDADGYPKILEAGDVNSGALRLTAEYLDYLQ